MVDSVHRVRSVYFADKEHKGECVLRRAVNECMGGCGGNRGIED